MDDPSLAAIMAYLQKRELPEEEKAARELVLGEPMYTVVDGVLYHVERDKTLRIIPPTADRRKLFLEAHEGPFSGHLREAKMYSQLSRYYWWWGMRKDISQWCRAYLVCAKHGIGRPTKPLLTAIPVDGPFDRVGVDVLKMPKRNMAIHTSLCSWTTSQSGLKHSLLQTIHHLPSQNYS